MAASPWHLAHLDVARQDTAPRRLRALAAFCDAHPDDEAQAGAVNWLRPITGGRALYDGGDGAACWTTRQTKPQITILDRTPWTPEVEVGNVYP